MSLAQREIILNSRPYVLAPREQASKYGYQGRRWQSIRRKKTTQYTERSDVRKGEIPGEWIVTWDSWDKGMWGDRDAPPGTYHFSSGIETRVPGRAYISFYPSGVNLTTVAMGADPCWSGDHKGTYFVIAGRYALAYADGAYASSQDLGAAFIATDATIWNDELVVGGGTTGYIWVRDNTGSWAQSTDTYATYFTPVEDRLWRSASTNEVSNIGPTDAPETVANWGGTLTVGNDDYNITDLNSMGYRLVISKEEGLFFGDSSAVVPNSLPDMATLVDADNGKQTLVRGNEIFYPFVKGLKYLAIGSAPIADEIGPNISFQSSVNEYQPGMRVTATAAEGEWVYATMEPLGRPLADPTGFQKTVNLGAAYTDYTAAVTDNTNSTTAVLDALSTVANEDWIIIGYSTPFYGAQLQVKNPNTNTSVMTVEYWDGDSWEPMTVLATYARTAHDYTAVGGKSLARSQSILWRALPPTWATSLLGGTTAYWIRVSFSAALSATVDISECRVMTTVGPKSFILAGRKASYGDPGQNRYVWHTLQFVTMPRITALGITNIVDGNRGRTLVCSGQQRIIHIFLDEFPTQPSLLQEYTGILTLPRHDGGMPATNKEWYDITVYGKNIDASHTWSVLYRVNESTTWLSGPAGQTAGGTVALNSTYPTGRMMQLELDLEATSLTDIPPEINKVEVRFREMPTYKNEYIALLEVANDQRLSSGTINLAAADQITNLEALQGAAAVALTDPIGRAKTVTVAEVQEVEFIQVGESYPMILVQVRMEEV